MNGSAVKSFFPCLSLTIFWTLRKTGERSDFSNLKLGRRPTSNLTARLKIVFPNDDDDVDNDDDRGTETTTMQNKQPD